MKRVIFAAFACLSYLPTSTTFADVQNPNSQIPSSTTFNHVKGWTFHYVDDRYTHYKVQPGPGRYCKLDFFFDTRRTRPYDPNGETFLQVVFTYVDPALTGSDGRSNIYMNFKFEPTAAQPTPFYPGNDWESSLGNGKILAYVSYDEAANSTTINFERHFMLTNFAWATIVTTPDHRQIKSIRISRHLNQEDPEQDREESFECTNE